MGAAGHEALLATGDDKGLIQLWGWRPPGPVHTGRARELLLL